MALLTPLQDFGRWLLLLAVRLVFRPGPALPLDAASIRKVLVVRPDPRVGNVLLTVPLLRALRESLPGARIELLLAPGKAPLVEGLPFIDGLREFDKQTFFRAPGRFLAFLRALRAERYDLAIEAGHWHAFSFTAGLLTWATGARYRLGHDRGLSANFLTHAIAHDPARVQEVAAKLELLGPLSVAAAEPTPTRRALETRLGSDEATRARLAPLLPKGRYAAINVGARKPDHRWPAERYGRLAVGLHAEGLIPLLLWGPGELPLAEAARAASGELAVVAPPTRLDELAATFRGAAVCITNDTGPMHLASAVGAPLCVCFTAEDGERWGHPGPRFRGVHVHRSADDVGEVLAAVRELLKG